MLDYIENSIIIPKKNRVSSISQEEAWYIYSFLRQKKIKLTLEVGFGYGYSAAYIVSATKKQHVVIDPFQSRYNYLGIFNIKKLRLFHKIKHIPNYSHAALPQLVKQKKTYEFIFIDGGHLYDQVFLDFYYADLLTSRGGYILFHDVWMQSTQFVISWIRTNRLDYKILKTSHGNLALIHKVGVDKRPFTHFVDFYPWRYKVRAMKHMFKMLIFKFQKESRALLF